MAAASKSANGKAAASAKAKKAEPKEKVQDPLPAPTGSVAPSTSGRRLVAQIVVAVVVGVVLGGYAAVYLIETEYKNIVSRLRADHQSLLHQTQDGYRTCQATLAGEKQSNEAELAQVLRHAHQNERAFQMQAERYLNETIAAYRTAHDGLDKASVRLKAEADNHAVTRLELDRSEEKLRSARASVAEATREHRKQLDMMEMQLQQAQRELDAARGELSQERDRGAILTTQMDALRRELDSAIDELDRRDIERAECDDHHRTLRECRDSLQEAREKCSDQEGALAEELAIVRTQRDELAGRIKPLVEGEREWQARVTEMERRVEDIGRDRTRWEEKAKAVVEKIKFRNRKEVNEEYGPGPHRVKITLEFTTPPENEVIVLELAPLESMPHTVHTFLHMMKKQMYVDGTFILSREHILVGGPVDVHDKENNQAMEEQMIEEGYFPGGALLFNEYSSDFPHEQWTIGFNDGGPIFYVNLRDNTELHGPSYNEREGHKEGDPCFAKIVEGVDVIQRVASIPRSDDDSLQSVVYIADTVVMQ